MCCGTLEMGMGDSHASATVKSSHDNTTELGHTTARETGSAEDRFTGLEALVVGQLRLANGINRCKLHDNCRLNNGSQLVM